MSVIKIPKGDGTWEELLIPKNEGIPVGGATGKVLKKASAADYDTEWGEAAGGTSLTKATGTEVNTGTDDAKYVTAKAITDSNVAFMADIPTTIPIGGTVIWPSDTAPTNWLICNGQAVSRTTYATLFGVIGTTFGVGDGSTTFNVLDMRDYVPVGKSATDANIDTIGEKYGAKTQVLTLDHLPYDVVVSNGPQVTNGWCTGIWNNFTGAYSTNARGALGTHGQGHNNMQPSIALNYIIKAL